MVGTKILPPQNSEDVLSGEILANRDRACDVVDVGFLMASRDVMKRDQTLCARRGLP